MAEIPKNKFGNVPVKWVAKRARWMLTTYDGGKKRRFFKRKKDAVRAWRSHVRAVGRYGRQAAEYDVHAHREYVEARRIAGDVDLRDVARFYASHNSARDVSLLVNTAVADFLAAKKARNVSERHALTLKTHLNVKLCAAFGARRLLSVKSKEVLDWLLALAEVYDARTIWNYYKSLVNFFGWCRRREFLASSPMDNISEDDLPEVVAKPKGVLTVDQAAAMMRWLELNQPDSVVWHALQLFAGIRNAEASRFQWDWIDCNAKVIDMPGWLFVRTGEVADTKAKATRVVKTGDDWVLHDLPDNLWEWLCKYRPDSGVGLVPTPDLWQVSVWRKTDFPKLDSPIPAWPNNAMRHTFCTMLVSYFGDAAKVANWSRHTSPKMLYQSYVAKLVSRAEAKRFMEIVPAA